MVIQECVSFVLIIAEYVLNGRSKEGKDEDGNAE